MIFTLTFELRDLSCCALGKTLVAGITGQRHGNATAAQQESNLLAAGVLLVDRKTRKYQEQKINIKLQINELKSERFHMSH